MKNAIPKQVPVFTFEQLSKLEPEQIKLWAGRATVEFDLAENAELPESPFGDDYWPVFRNGSWKWVQNPPLLMFPGRGSGS